jgi:hypothetical protein
VKRGFELRYDNAWQQVAAYEREGWKYKTGPSDLTGPEPGSLDFTLANDDLSMDPSNPFSPLYGKIGPNTNARMLMYDDPAVTFTDTFTRTASSSWGNSWTVSGGSASDFSVSSNVGRMSLGSLSVPRRATRPEVVSSGEVSARITIQVSPAGDAIDTSVIFQHQDSSNYLQAAIYWSPGGQNIELRFIRLLAGVAGNLATTSLTVTPSGASLSCDIRVRWFGAEMSMKVWPSATAEPATWNLSARSTQWTSGQWGFRGYLLPSFSNGTPQVVTFDNVTFSPYTAVSVAAGEISSWKLDTSVEHVPGVRGRSWTDVTADDLFRRIGKADDPDLSPLRRQISSYTSLLGYWPMEEGADAKNFANLVAPSKVGSFTPDLVDLAADDGPAGGFNAPVVDSGAVLSGRFIFDTSTNGYQLSWCMKLDALPGSGTYQAFIQWSDTMQRTWYWRVNNASFEIAVYDQFSTLLSSISGAFGTGVDPTTWVRYRIRVSVTGITLTYEPAWYAQDSLSTWGTSNSFSNASVGSPFGWQIVANAYTDKASFAHLFGISDTAFDIINGSDARDPFNAYNGETSWNRFVRLMQENGYGFLVIGNTATAAIMGRQPRARLSELLEEIQRTEAGVIYGEPARVRLNFRLNDSLINQTPVMALTKGTNVAYPLKKVIDDQGSANDITVKNWDTTAVRVQKLTGSRNVQEPSAGVGRYPGSLDVSFQWAESLKPRGEWELANNTLERPRYPAVSVDLLANPELIPAANVVKPGDLITLAGVEPAPVPLIVTQLQRSGGEKLDTLTMTCLPGELYVAGTIEDGVSLIDSGSTTLNEDLDTTETGVDIFTADPMEKWTSAAVGAVLQVGPETMTITAVATGSASGTGWAQTLTVTRSTNGVPSTHVTGEEVHVARPLRIVMLNRGPI